MAQGLLPNFKKLAKTGCYRRLQTTFPSVSPVAWSSFSTGTQPGRHNIFDFLDRDRRTYLPVLSSAHLGTRQAVLHARDATGFRARRPELRLLRKSKPFWVVLGEHRIWSTILRVPITFPPDRFYGAELSAMSVPDLLGTQGTFLLFTTRPAGERFKEGGTESPSTLDGDRIETAVEGPENPFAADAGRCGCRCASCSIGPRSRWRSMLAARGSRSRPDGSATGSRCGSGRRRASPCRASRACS